MKKVLVVLLAVAPMLAQAESVQTHADLNKIEKKLNACISKDESNYGMKICTSQAYEAADVILNQEYAKVKKSLNKNDQVEKQTLANLVKAQRAWVAFRDADCSYQAMWEYGGTGAGLINISCYYQMTVDRVKFLRQNN